MRADLYARVLVLCGGVTMAGCGLNMAEYRQIHMSARTSLPAAVQIEELFGDADHFITHYGMRSEKSNIWNTVTYFGGRYELTMQVRVRVDYDKKCIEVAGSPEFSLVEIRRVRKSTSGLIGADCGKNFRFSEDEWQKVLASGGDFSVIGIELDASSVADFDDFVAAVRKDRVPISLR